MTHDPVSAILRKTYEDSISFLIPRQNGVVQSNEIKVVQNRYKPLGIISISENEMLIKLYYDSAQTEPDGWNGKYNLKLR